MSLLLRVSVWTACLALVPTLAMLGCGGATTQDVFDSKEGASSSGSSGTSGGTSGTSGGTSGSGTSGTVGTDAGPVQDAGTDSSAACPQESEPNNNKATANTLAPTLCGTITPNSESDFLTFILKEKSTSLALNFTGQVTLKVDVNNQTVILGGPVSGKVPFVKNARYSVEVRATPSVNPTPWRVDLVEK